MDKIKENDISQKKLRKREKKRKKHIEKQMASLLFGTI